MLKLACVLLLCISGAFAADVSGAWQFSVNTSQGSGSPTVTLQQQGDKLTGTFHSLILGDAKLAGSVKGNTIEFAFEGDVQGQKLKITYKGTIESPTAMKGTAVYSGVDDHVTWSASKK
uniref:Lipocalin-like domain-containing protein n=1 Tax=Solibacter usitatus (strain Ellin6076) TaxID=234267 RepID=Q01YG4_SOLUE